MKISIDDYDKTYEPPKTKSTKICPLYFLSVGRILAILATLVVIGCILLLCKAYIKFVLLWLEKQDELVIAGTVCILFIIVSLPISVGYIVLVLASGYLFGIGKGLLLVVFGANIGLLIAHNLLKVVGYHPSIYRFTQNEMAVAIMQVISGPLCFKIVFCSRLTPIPFGLQNTIFALSNVSSRIYHVASLFGLFPAQLVTVYVGSTLRSMQDVIENNHISSTTYFIVVVQLICGISLIIWIGSKARNELMKVLSDADNASIKTSYSLV
ncbi:transmembrane protein 64 [Sitophilus oryzae]|uniref:Transmembrane protein 64 n=1 Tax=Sitophilus oryzae TaxID=7048 RepID=A0A6J2XW87_SITOR|nr:transmembrane protein 64 [Sitophilus oryzae]